MKALKIFILCTLLLCACNFSTKKKTELIPSTKFSVDNSYLSSFDIDDKYILSRYLKGNGKWEYRSINGKTFAFLNQSKPDDPLEYSISNDGYYHDRIDSCGLVFSRVIISFGNYVGDEESKGNEITFVTMKDTIINLRNNHSLSGSGNHIKSYLVVLCNGFNIEIGEDNCDPNRTYTQNALKKLKTELTSVISFKNDIKTNGIMPIPNFYPKEIDSIYFNIADGHSPGIYIAQAGVSPKEEGEVYVIAYYTKSNSSLSAKSISDKTTTQTGWSLNGETIFPYQREFTVFEGNWDEEYEARFELWFRNKVGIETKLNESIRPINGWQH